MTDRELALQTYLANPNTANRNALVAQHHALIKYVITRKLRVPSVLYADAFQEGIIGLCIGIARYEPSRGSFATCAMHWIRATVQLWMERNVRELRCTTITSRRKNGTQSRDSVIVSRRLTGVRQCEEGDELDEVINTVPDPSPGPFERSAAHSTSLHVKRVLAEFAADARESAVLRENVFGETPLNILAERFGVTKQRMCQIKSQLMSRLRESIEPEESRC